MDEWMDVILPDLKNWPLVVFQHCLPVRTGAQIFTPSEGETRLK